MVIIDFSDLTEDEHAMLFGIVNLLSPNKAMEYDEKTIKWMRKEIFVKRIIEANKHVIEEYKPIYDSLKKKIKIVT